MTTRTSQRSQSSRNPNQTRRDAYPRSGTIRNNMERSRSDSVSAAKAKQAANSTGTRPASQIRRENQKAVKKRRVRKLIIRLAVTLLVVLICVFCFLFTYRVFNDTAIDETNTTKIEFKITDPEISDEEVAEQLFELGCINDVKLYKLRTYIYDAKYVPGTYRISPSYTTEKIINILSGYDYSDGTMEE